MVTNIDEFCDDIISHIFSFLTIRDALRARLSSPKWLHLSDSRSVVKLDSLNILGNTSAGRQEKPADQSKFMKIANHFIMQVWAGNKMSSLTVKFLVGKQHIRQVEKWIGRAVTMKVEDIEIGITRCPIDFSGNLIQHESTPYLKRLFLIQCTPNFWCTSLLGNITTLQFCGVPMDRSKIYHILSAGTNLISLELMFCKISEALDVHHLHLKTLKIFDFPKIEVKLNCPSLEVFHYNGPLVSLGFAHVPALRETNFEHTTLDIFSMLFNHTEIQAPRLESLRLTIEKEVIPFPPKVARCGIKELTIVVTNGLDLLSVSNLLNACPCLEKLHLEMLVPRGSFQAGRRKYRDQSHYMLKKVKITHFYEEWNVMNLAKYLVRNAVELEEMIIVIPRSKYVKDKFEFLKEINPTVKITISHDVWC